MAKRKSQTKPKPLGWPAKTGITVIAVIGVAAVAGSDDTKPAAASPGLSKHMKDIRFCESTDRYTVVSKVPVRTKAGIEYAEGAYQFLPSTWAEWKTGYAHPADAPASVQDAVAVKHQAKYGDAPWLASKPCWSKR